MQKSKIKVYFDASPLESVHAIRGVGYYTKNLLEHLHKCKEIKLVSNPREADIVHFPYFDLFFYTLKPVSGIKNVVTVFDVIPLIYPKHYPPGVKGRINLLRQKRALSRVDGVITISETSKKDIVRFLDVPSDKAHPIHLAPNEDFRLITDNKSLTTLQEKYNLPDFFVLYVGDVNYNKNIISLVKACVDIDVPLVIVGKQAAQTEFDRTHIENRDLTELIEKYGNNPNILRLGYVSQGDLVGIYNLASVYCQPSLYEGFGLPILEAQACGTPVVCTKIQVLVEIAESSCLFVNSDSESIAGGIEELLNNNAAFRELAKKGLQNAKRYSWKKTTLRTIEIYKKVYESL